MKKFLLAIPIAMVALSSFAQVHSGDDFWYVGDTSYTLYTGFPKENPNTESETLTIYFNGVNGNENKAVYGFNPSNSTVITMGGAGASSGFSYVNPKAMIEGSVNKATISYGEDKKITVAKADNITLFINDVLPFVSPIALEIPEEGVTVYKFEKYENGIVHFISDENPTQIEANIPVILKVEEPNNYSFGFAVNNENIYEEILTDSNNNNRKYLADVAESESPFYGVHQAHLVPENGFVFDGSKFIKPTDANTVVNTMECYLKLDDASDLTFIQIAFDGEYDEVLELEGTINPIKNGFTVTFEDLISQSGIGEISSDPTGKGKIESSIDDNVLTVLLTGFENGDYKVTIPTHYLNVGSNDINKEVEYTVSINTLKDQAYVLGDANWTAMGYFPIGGNDNKATVYLNVHSSYKDIYSLSSKYTTNGYLTGGGNGGINDFTLQESPQENVLYAATLDYAEKTLTFAKADKITLNISNWKPFVAAAEVVLPEGVVAYAYESLKDGILTVKELPSLNIPANTPVILQANEEGEYTLSFSGKFIYNLIDEEEEGGKKRGVLEDSSVSGSFYGVHQPHIINENAYIFEEGKFVKAGDNYIAQPLTCYVIAEDADDEISIDFKEAEYKQPKEIYLHFTDENGDYSATHDKALTLNEDGSYSVKVELTQAGSFVLADTDFESEVETVSVRSENGWAALGDKATIYSSNGNPTLDDTETISTWSSVAVAKVADLEDVTPFSLEPQVTYTFVMKPTSPAFDAWTLSAEVDADSSAVNRIEENNENDVMYDLLGRKVNSNYKGLVIKNGKKMILR